MLLDELAELLAQPRRDCQEQILRVFKALGPAAEGLNPEVELIVINVDQEHPGYGVGRVLPSCDVIDAEFFEDAVSVAERLREPGNPRSLASRIHQVLNLALLPRLNSSYRFSHGQPIPAGEDVSRPTSLVIPVVMVARAAADRFRMQAESEDSLVLSVIRECARRTSVRVAEETGLNQPIDPSFPSEWPVDQILITSGDEFFYWVALSVLEQELESGSLQERLAKTFQVPRRFQVFNELSSLAYERRDSEGRVLLAQVDHPDIHVLMNLSEPTDLTKVGVVRKLLETTSEEVFLLCDVRKAWGLGRLLADTVTPTANLFKIQFKGRFAWTLSQDERRLMDVRNGVPSLPFPILDRGTVEQVITARLGENSDPARVYEMLTQAAGQRHGTLVVVSAEATKEAVRLRMRSIPIQPSLLGPELIEPLTRIDGALLLDPQGMCHAVGVILDGKASPKTGDRGRGSRFNSAKTYLDSRAAEGQGQCFAVVVSEDGMVQVLEPEAAQAKS